MDINAQIACVSAIRKRQSQIADIMHNHAATLVVLDAELCELLTSIVTDHGVNVGASDDIVASSVEPKIKR